MARTRRRVRLRGRFFVFVFILLAIVIGLVILLVSGNGGGEIELGTARMKIDRKAVLIRDETLVTTEQYDKIIFEVSEGEYVTEGTRIAQVFRWGYQDETMLALLNTQKEILAHQLTLMGDVLNPKLDEITEGINTALEQMRAIVSQGQTGDVLELEQKMKDLLEQRAENLKNAVQADATLTDLYAQQDEQLTALDSWKRDIVNSEGEGIVSFYFDGYEQALNANKLDLIDATLVNSALKSSNTVTSRTSTADTPLYRLTDTKHWYVAFLTDASGYERVVEGETYTVAFADYSDAMYTGVALKPVVSDNYVVNILEFDRDIGALLGVRTAQLSVHKDAQGLRVPVQALRMQNGVTQIVLQAGERSETVNVDVLAFDGQYAVIQAADGSTSLTSGRKYIVE